MLRQPSFETDLLHCTCCNLRKEALNPVLPSFGETNIMIIGEAPGTDENIEGKGFVGRAGILLWNIIRILGYERTFFHITNAVKCYPGKEIKTPNETHIECCSKWLKQEFNKLNPNLILVFGNTGLKYFLNQTSGIKKKSGTIEWNEEYQCNICWCIHPASALYNPGNKTLLIKSLKIFIDEIKKIEFLTIK